MVNERRGSWRDVVVMTSAPQMLRVGGDEVVGGEAGAGAEGMAVESSSAALNLIRGGAAAEADEQVGAAAGEEAGDCGDDDNVAEGGDAVDESEGLEREGRLIEARHERAVGRRGERAVSAPV